MNELEQFKQGRAQKELEHSKRQEKYRNVTRQRKTFKVYMHVNKYNGRKYIGITCEPVNSRWRGGRAYKCNEHFKHAIDKYGWDEGFEHLVLFDGLTQQEAMDKEVELIAKYRNTPEGVYNITDGGEHYIQTPESIAKMRETKKNNMTPEVRKHISIAAKARGWVGENNPFYGKTHTQKTKQIISEKHWSKTNPDKFYECVRDRRMGSGNPNAKKIIRLSDSKIYQCIKDCSLDNNICRDSITSHCKGVVKNPKFMYLKDWESLHV